MYEVDCFIIYIFFFVIKISDGIKKINKNYIRVYFSFETNIMIWSFLWKAKTERHYHTLVTMQRVAPFVEWLIRYILCQWWLTRTVVWKVVFNFEVNGIKHMRIKYQNNPSSIQVLHSVFFHTKDCFHFFFFFFLIELLWHVCGYDFIELLHCASQKLQEK